MWPLVLVSLLLWSLILRKGLWLLTAAREWINISQASEWLRRGEVVAKKGGLCSGALGWFLARRSGVLQADLRMWRAAALRQAGMIPRHLPAIMVLAAAAPLLGLLGTVTGMIETFTVIREYGTGNAQALAAGISEALITTQTGLLVAIPGFFVGYVLRRQAGKIQRKFTSFQKKVEGWLKSEEAAGCPS
jgi:biopolymer transport protein ExbB